MFKFLRRLLLATFTLVILAIAGLWLNWSLSTPSHDRTWRADQARLPQVEQAGDLWRMKDVRNWSYAPDGQASSREWIDLDVDPGALTRAWFLMEPFGEIDAIAHTMLGFEFSDGTVLISSVEARREADEVYNAPKALVLPIFETIIVWSTERDMLGNSTFWAQDDVFMYPLELSAQGARAVLEGMLHATARVQESPQWYNTIFSNCTNVLARAVNKSTDGAVPFHYAWYLPGYADEFLYGEGFLAGDGTFEDISKKALVTPIVPELYEVTDPKQFSRDVRARLGV